VLHSSALAGCYVTCRRGQGSLKRGSTLVLVVDDNGDDYDDDDDLCGLRKQSPAVPRFVCPI
jgi:hypothetical protein